MDPRQEAKVKCLVFTRRGYITVCSVRPRTHENIINTHQLHCPEFQSLRNKHQHAIGVLSRNKSLLWMPLPTHPDNIELIRGSDLIHSPMPITEHSLHVYDGSCDEPKRVYLRKSVWAVVLWHGSSCEVVGNENITHTSGKQTISRADHLVQLSRAPIISFMRTHTEYAYLHR